MGGAAKLLHNQAKTGFPQETSFKKPVSATETQVLPMRVSSFLPAQVIQAASARVSFSWIPWKIPADRSACRQNPKMKKKFRNESNGTSSEPEGSI
jgi:hypothetical protein